MNTANSGAVFFLGTRAHYQVLTPPNTHHFDVENGNESTETIYRNPSTDLWPDKSADKYHNIYTDELPERRELDYDGVKRRLRKNRKQDGSSELILNDNDDCRDGGLGEDALDSDNNKPAKPKRSRVSVAYLLTLLARRRRTLRAEDVAAYRADVAAYQMDACTFRNSCRCDDCQSRYFDCDDEDSDVSDEDYSISEGSDYSQQYLQQYAAQQYAQQQYAQQQYAEQQYAEQQYARQQCEQSVDEGKSIEDEEDDDDEVFIDTPPADTASTERLLASPAAQRPSVPALRPSVPAQCPSAPAQRPFATAQRPSATADEEEGALTMEIAASAPLLLNHVLSHPFTCAVM